MSFSTFLLFLSESLTLYFSPGWKADELWRQRSDLAAQSSMEDAAAPQTFALMFSRQGVNLLLLIQKFNKLRCMWQSLSKILMVKLQGQKAFQLHLHQGYSAGSLPKLEEVVWSVQPTQEHCSLFFAILVLEESDTPAFSYQLFYKRHGDSDLSSDLFFFFNLLGFRDCYVDSSKGKKKLKT